MPFVCERPREPSPDDSFVRLLYTTCTATGIQVKWRNLKLMKACTALSSLSPTTTTTTETTLLTHIASQTASNIDLLVANGYLTQAEAASAAKTIPSPVNNSTGASPSVVQAKALWAYNLDPDDLSFAAGDIITVIEETNADWWLGEHNGCRALFPANYVEKITVPAPAARTLPLVYIPPTGGQAVPPAPVATQKKEYKPFMDAHPGANVPPPPGSSTNSVGLQQDPGQDGKKSKFGKYGNTTVEVEVQLASFSVF
ncbi:uncharacterized protein EV420DRAFT_1745424 [Desarmillaria tabescens]|uniref:SH3 domain-containing protein n=1 Tax=Armillaria tabescens TaxID=1929756 RepID=A0AA39T3Y2_ARMTA|nr:uncharacterized protein EV420DRAFT_1745424 [Desarmillaria tabescens]KAK0462821.1 hypothetical protein EV420DRAFT_1745424 [Desarmillaria tabescens]